MGKSEALPTIWEIPDHLWEQIHPVILDMDPPKGTGRNPTDRGKSGSKKSILVDAAGGPLSVAVAGANVHDTKVLRPTLESIVVARPEGAQNLSLEKGMTIPPATGPLPPSSTVRTSGALGRSWTGGERGPLRPDGGWWNAPWPGCPSAGRSWCATTRRHPTTWASSSWPAPCSGTAASTGYCFEIIS